MNSDIDQSEIQQFGMKQAEIKRRKMQQWEINQSLIQQTQDLRTKSQNLEGLVSRDRLKPRSFVQTFEVCVSPETKLNQPRIKTLCSMLSQMRSISLILVLLLSGCQAIERGGDARDPVAASSPNAATPTSAPTAATGGQVAAPGGEGAVKVVATNALLCNVVNAVAQAALEARAIALTCLMQPGQDPHVYRLKPSDRQAIEEADLVLYGGYNFEPGILTDLQESRVKQVAVFEVAVPQPLFMGAHDHEHEHGDEILPEPEHESEHESEHDAERVPDPHVWHRAANGQAIVTTIADQLSALTPNFLEQYQQAADQLQKQLAQLELWIPQQVATVPATSRELVTSHNAFGYFVTAYGLDHSSAIAGLSTIDQPSPSELAAIVENIKTRQIQTLFTENTSNLPALQAVAREAGVKLSPQPLLVDSPDPKTPEATTYPAMLAYNTCVVVQGLGGTCDRAALGF